MRAQPGRQLGVAGVVLDQIGGVVLGRRLDQRRGGKHEEQRVVVADFLVPQTGEVDISQPPGQLRCGGTQRRAGAGEVWRTHFGGEDEDLVTEV